MSRESLQEARNVKNDEFYTRYEDIESFLLENKELLKDKYILCPCDLNIEEVDLSLKENQKDWYNFSKFFNKYKKELGIKEVYYSHYNPETMGGGFIWRLNCGVFKETSRWNSYN